MKKRYFAICFVLIALAAVSVFLFSQPTYYLTNDFLGTYVDGGIGFSQRIFSVDRRENLFYYADQDKNHFIVGQVRDLGNCFYEIFPENSDHLAIIPKQEVKCSEKEFTMTISGIEVPFTKTDQTPIIIGDTSNYS